MDKCREAFLKDVAEVVPCWCARELQHYEYDAKANCFRFEGHGKFSNYTLALNNMWCIYQHQQAKVDELEKEWLEMNQELEKEIQVGFEVNKENRELQTRIEWLDGLKNSLNELAQKYRSEAHELSLIRDIEKSQMYSHFARELDQLLKGGA